MLSPEDLSDFGPLLFADSFGCVGLDRADEGGQGEFGWVVDEEMDVVGFAVGFHECDPVTVAYLLGDVDDEFAYPVGDGVASVFGDEDDMGVKVVDHVSSGPVICCFVSHVCYCRPS